MEALEIIPIFNPKKRTLRLDSKHITSKQSWRTTMTVRIMTMMTTMTTTNNNNNNNNNKQVCTQNFSLENGVLNLRLYILHLILKTMLLKSCH